MRRIILAATVTAVLASSVALAEPIDDAEAAFSRGDYELAAQMFRPLAEQGDAEAQTRLGYMFRTGRGVAVDKTESLKWYRLAADQGNQLAKFNLSSLVVDLPERGAGPITSAENEVEPKASLTVNEALWNSLTAQERDTLSNAYSVATIAANRVGEIVDVQMLNESTAGSTSGAELGSKIASDRYIDRTFSGDDWNYSAEKHTRNQLVGALIGSLLDSPPTESYHFRYSIKSMDGEVHYVDEIKADAFRRSVGECVDVNSLQSIYSEACESRTQRIRGKYLSGGEMSLREGSSSVGSANSPAIADRLKVLDSLRKEGLITDAEYKKRRAEILSEI